jgi:hypothetical protein
MDAIFLSAIWTGRKGLWISPQPLKFLIESSHSSGILKNY